MTDDLRLRSLVTLNAQKVHHTVFVALTDKEFESVRRSEAKLDKFSKRVVHTVLGEHPTDQEIAIARQTFAQVYGAHTPN